MIDKPSHNVIAAFPDMKGFPRRNLIYMRSFAKEWTEPEFVQQVVAQLSWGQNLLLTKLKTRSDREWYLPSIEQIEAELQVEVSLGNEDTPA